MRAQVQAEEVPEISERYDIIAVPTFVFFKVNWCGFYLCCRMRFVQNGGVVDRVNGANAPELTKRVEALSQSITTTITIPAHQVVAQPKTAEDLAV